MAHLGSRQEKEKVKEKDKDTKEKKEKKARDARDGQWMARGWPESCGQVSSSIYRFRD